MELIAKFNKSLGKFNLDINLTAKCSSTALLGASGSGKTLTLKLIAGLLKPDSGLIVLNGKVLYDSEEKINLSPQKRNIAYLFQNYALFPNMNVVENIRCGLRKFKYDESTQNKNIDDVISLLQLNGLQNHKPYQLSGGQQQRVALARILVSKPDLLLLDEPFSALDEYLRTRLEISTKEVIDKYKIPTILVTHSRDEAYMLCEDTAIIDKGNIVINKNTKELFKNPEFYSAALLSGCKNITPAILQKKKVVLPKWGISFNYDGEEEFSYIGVRAHSFKEADKKAGYKIKYIGVIEQPFERLIRFRFVNQSKDSEDIYWLVKKDEALPQSEYISFDPSIVLYLK